MSSWQKEIVIVCFLFLLTTILGVLTGHFLLLLLLLVLGLLIYQIIQINRFEHWIRSGGKGVYPISKGIWEDIYYHLYRLKKADKKRKKQLGKMIDQFRKSTEALPDAAVVLGVNDEIEWANKMAADVLGLQQADKGQRIQNLIRFPEFIRYLKVGKFSENICIPSPVNKQIILSLRIVVYGKGLRLLLAQDVTALKKMELMRKDFVANVSHELRTPLTVLKGYLETLQDMEEPNKAILINAFQQMQAQTDRMQALVDDLLLLTRLETKVTNHEPVDVPSLLLEICSTGNLHSANTQRIELSLESDRQLFGEEQELRSAFTNLIENALKYSPEDKPVKVRWYRQNAEQIFSVEDFGEGISPANIPRVTERFYRCEVKRDKSVSGTGLGLAIVKHVLLRHEGRLNINSKLNFGSVFSCHFPASAQL